jgi:hypothetical protein
MGAVFGISSAKGEKYLNAAQARKWRIIGSQTCQDNGRTL